MSEAAHPTSAGSTIALSVHGPAGVLDLVVPAGATSVDVARAYAAQADLPGLPLLQTPLGGLVDAGRSLAEVGVVSGDLLVAVSGVHRARASTDSTGMRDVPDNPGLATLLATLAAAFAAVAAWYAARAGDDVVRTATVAVLLGCALAGALPWGRHARQRTAAAPAFGAAAAFAALFVTDAVALPAVLASAALAAAVVAAIGRAMAEEADEVSRVWITAALTVAAVCATSPMLGWDARVPWTLLVLLSMLAARFVPSLAIDVPDEALLDLDRLAVTAWSARDSGKVGRRGRIVVAGEAMTRLVHSAARVVTAASAAVLVVVVSASALLLHGADIDLDRIGARCLVFFSGASLLLAARSYRHQRARGLLRAAGLATWVCLVVELVAAGAATHLLVVFAVLLALGLVVVAAAVASGRGWRSVWWSRRAEVAESLCGSLAFASAVVAAGLFRALWEITS